MKQLSEAAPRRGLTKMAGQVLAEDEMMQTLMEALGFSVSMTDDPRVLEVGCRL